jgi:gas vesicle protein
MEDKLPPIAICVGDFNIQDPEWDPTTMNRHGRSATRLRDFTSHMELSYAVPENHPTPTHILDQDSQRPSIIDLVFAPFNLTDEGGLKVTVINEESMHFTSDHNMVRINIPFANESPCSRGRILEEWMEEEDQYVNMIGEGVHNSVRKGEEEMKSAEGIERVVEEIARIMEEAWMKYTKERKPSKHGKQWWNKDCKQAFREVKTRERGPERYREKRKFKKIIQKT